MKVLSAVFLKYCVIIVLVCILFFSVARCQDEDEDDEDTYDEELGDGDTTTTTRRPRRTSTARASTLGQTETSVNSNSTRRTVAEATTRASVPASAQAPTRRVTVRTTTLSEYEDDEATTEEEGYGYIFRPLTSLVENIAAGNVTGIVDNALSIRTPPEIRAFVNNVMSNVFGAGIGNALKQFMPNLFSTQAPPTHKPGRDPIPTSQPAVPAVIPQPIPVTAVLTARTNGTEEVNKAAKQKQPLQIALAHPGAPASRLRCEVIA